MRGYPYVRCGRCGGEAEEYAEITTLGDIEPSYVITRCGTPGCGTACPICHRKPGDVHSGACMPIIEAKLTDQVYVSREDCWAVVR